jgi:diguanylate cyclase (GGDEF)-like protein
MPMSEYLKILIAAIIGCILSWMLNCVYRFYKLKKEFSLSQQQLYESTQKQIRTSQELAELQKVFDNNILHDTVTGLPGRHVFEDRLQQTINESKRYGFMFALLFLDIDEFKIINDVLGHEVGDVLLKEVGARLKVCIRQVDTICRYAGDEFVFILPQLAKGEAAAYVAQRLLDVISQPFIIEGNELFITSCIGICIYPADGDNAKTLVKKADATLHQAKTHGQNTYEFYHQEMQTLGRRELMLNSHLRNERVYQELAIYYQPILNIKTKTIIAMEALLRWQHGELGLITPK